MKEFMNINKQAHGEIRMMPVFLTSLALSMFLINLNQNELLLQSKVLSESSLSLIKHERGVGNLLFFHVIKERIWVIPLLFLMSTTYLAHFFSYGMLIWYGTSFGALLAVAMLRYKVVGIVFLLMCGLPQYILYVPVFIVALRLCAEQRNPDKKFFLQLLVLEAVVLVGCILESYVNSAVIEKIIKIFLGI